MNYKKPVIDKLLLEKNISISNSKLDLLLSKFTVLVNYDFSRVELLIDIYDGVLFDEFATTIQIFYNSQKIIAELDEQD